MRLLRPIEEKLVRSADPARHPVIFIIGPPRSGSTLFYELVVTRFGFAYFSNFAHAFYDVPALATLLTRPRRAPYRARYRSNYARIPGWRAPNEGVRIWRRWIPEEHYLDRPLPEPAASALRGTIAAIARIADAPFVNKNTMHSVHLRVLDALFPHCVFLEIRRRPDATVRSILRLRLDRQGPDRVDQWRSVRPPGWEAFRQESPVVQACAQVLLTERAIDADMRALGPERRLLVSYEALCGDPPATLDTVADFLRGRRVPIEIASEVPQRFPSPPEPALPPGLDQPVDRTYAALAARLGALEAS